MSCRFSWDGLVEIFIFAIYIDRVVMNCCMSC
jgi:hypothetical protein